MKLLVFGKTGQVARELAAIAPRAVFLGRDSVDLSTDPDAAARLIAEHAPEAVINAAAYTAVDKAEEEEAAAARLNADAPAAMSGACAAVGIPFVHISTDYVFDGAGKSAFRPDDPTGPLGAYGRTKLAGELRVQNSGAAYAILRTSWVFSAHGGNFVKTMLRLGAERDLLTIVADQVGGPTPAADIAQACIAIADALISDPTLSGTYHYSGAPDVSWAGFAKEIFRQSGINCVVKEIPTVDYPTPAKRPLNSRMNCDTTLEAFGISRPDWAQGLAAVLEELNVR